MSVFILPHPLCWVFLDVRNFIVYQYIHECTIKISANFRLPGKHCGFLHLLGHFPRGSSLPVLYFWVDIRTVCVCVCVCRHTCLKIWFKIGNSDIIFETAISQVQFKEETTSKWKCRKWDSARNTLLKMCVYQITSSHAAICLDTSGPSSLVLK